VRLLARLAQFAGLVIAGSGFFVGLLGHDERRELLLLAIGAGVFTAGWLLQRSVR
jgi:hypothetical protein